MNTSNSEDSIDRKLRAATILMNPAEVERLLVEGANPNHVDQDGWTPLMYACKYESPEIAAILMKNGGSPMKENSNRESAFSISKRKVRSHDLLAALETPPKDQLTYSEVRPKKNTNTHER